MKAITRSEITAEPRDAVTNRIKANDVKSGLRRLTTTRLQALKTRIRVLGGEGKPDSTPNNRAGGERIEPVHFGPLGLEPAPVATIHRKNQKEDAASAVVGMRPTGVIRSKGRWPRG